MTPATESLATKFHQCRQSFDAIISLINSQSGAASALKPAWEDEASRLRLWGANIGAAQIKANTSLDFRLRDAETVREQIRKNLSNLNEALEEALDCLKRIGNQDSLLAAPSVAEKNGPGRGSIDDIYSSAGISRSRLSSPSQVQNDVSEQDGLSDGSENYEEDLQDAFDDTVSLINSLFRMTLYIRNPSRRDQLKKRDTSAVANFEAFDVSHVENKFPQADNLLTRRLGQANTVRRANLRYWERHHKKLAYDELANDGADDGTTVAPMSESVATTFQPVKEEEKHDTRSHFSGTSYMSSLLGGDTVKRPSLPEAGQNGAPFQCPICCYFVTVSDQREWMKHVFYDLQPYVCVFTTCKTPLLLYENRRDWFGHVLNNHLPSKEHHPILQIDCPLCHEATRSGPLIRRHLARHLEELALFSLPNSLFDDETEAVDDNNASDDSLDGEELSFDEPEGEVSLTGPFETQSQRHGLNDSIRAQNESNIPLEIAADQPGLQEDASADESDERQPLEPQLGLQQQSSFPKDQVRPSYVSGPFARDPKSQALRLSLSSRQPNASELAAMKAYADHVRTCEICISPGYSANVYPTLCAQGIIHAKEVDSRLYSKWGIVMGKMIVSADLEDSDEITIPFEIRKTIYELLVAIEKGFDVRYQRPFASVLRRDQPAPPTRLKEAVNFEDSDSGESDFWVPNPIERERKPYVALDTNTASEGPRPSTRTSLEPATAKQSLRFSNEGSAEDRIVIGRSGDEERAQGEEEAGEAAAMEKGALTGRTDDQRNKWEGRFEDLEDLVWPKLVKSEDQWRERTNADSQTSAATRREAQSHGFDGTHHDIDPDSTSIDELPNPGLFRRTSVFYLATGAVEDDGGMSVNALEGPFEHDSDDNFERRARRLSLESSSKVPVSPPLSKPPPEPSGKRSWLFFDNEEETEDSAQQRTQEQIELEEDLRDEQPTRLLAHRLRDPITEPVRPSGKIAYSTDASRLGRPTNPRKPADHEEILDSQRSTIDKILEARGRQDQKPKLTKVEKPGDTANTSRRDGPKNLWRRLYPSDVSWNSQSEEEEEDEGDARLFKKLQPAVEAAISDVSDAEEEVIERGELEQHPILKEA